MSILDKVAEGTSFRCCNPVDVVALQLAVRVNDLAHIKAYATGVAEMSLPETLAILRKSAHHDVKVTNSRIKRRFIIHPSS